MLPRLWLLVGSDRPTKGQTMSVIELSWTAKKTKRNIVLICKVTTAVYQGLPSRRTSLFWRRCIWMWQPSQRTRWGIMAVQSVPSSAMLCWQAWKTGKIRISQFGKFSLRSKQGQKKGKHWKYWDDFCWVECSNHLMMLPINLLNPPVLLIINNKGGQFWIELVHFFHPLDDLKARR